MYYDEESKSTQRRKKVQKKPESSYGVQSAKEILSAVAEVKQAMSFVELAKADNKPIDMSKNLDVLKARVDSLEALVNTLLS